MAELVARYKAWFQRSPAESAEIRRKKVFSRFMRGSEMRGDYRLLTLTTPETFVGNLNYAWKLFKQRMRRRGVFAGYFAVKEWNEKRTCTHLHVVCRLSYVDYTVARQQWHAVTGAEWIHVDKVANHRGMGHYMIKYLTKASLDAPGQRSYWASYQWTYKTAVGFHKRMFVYSGFATGIDTWEDQHIHNMGSRQAQVAWMNERLMVEWVHPRNRTIPLELVPG